MSDTFDINQTPNSSESVSLNYLPMGLSGVMMDTQNNWVTGLCSRSASPNITYTSSDNVKTNYYANKLWILGSATGTNYPLHKFSGYPSGQLTTDGTPTAELVIQNFSEDGLKTVYMCFLLDYVGTSAPPGGQIQNIFNAVTNDQTEVTVDLNGDIFGNVDPSAVYLQYTSQTLGSGADVIIYSNPIRIGASLVNVLQNNLGLFDMYDSPYTIIPMSEPGSWMECDYVPIDSEEVASYYSTPVEGGTVSMPLTSGIVAEAGTNNSLKTIISFMVFAVLCGIAYTIVPDCYLFLVRLIIGKGYISSQGEVNRVFWLDLFLSIAIGGTAITLICIGAFGNPASIPNTGVLLSTGLTMGIFYTLCYVIIQSKKMGDNFLPGGINYNMQPTV
jgi:hypothetical protein|tara:strand:+ start:1455 stop:2618 length:1164 start_codon:yes stop_codon:yes gene_type:complete